MNAVVEEIMSAYPVSARVTSSFKELAAGLRQFGISGFPVLDDDGKVVGVVSEADLLAQEVLDGRAHSTRGTISRLVHGRQSAHVEGITAGDLMTSPAVTVTPGETVSRAARLMYDRGLRRLPVVDAEGRLAGIVSRADVLAVFDRPDEEIRLEIVGQVLPRLSEPSWYAVVVMKGIVTLEGSPETAKIGHAVVAQVRRVPGVVAVRDRLVHPSELIIAAPGPYFPPRR